MSENIITLPGRTLILNGGDPLDGCPKDWEEAYLIEEKLNEGKSKYEPKWDFDCGFKLDLDGSLLNISSRFYPPKTHYGGTWDGKVHVMFLGKDISEKKFDCKTLDELKSKVETYVKSIIDNISSFLHH